MQHAKSTHDRKGTSILELLFSLSIMSTILMSVFAIIQRDTSLAQSTLGISLAETKAQQMLRKIETELADARGANPIARLTAPLEEGNSMELSVDSTLGFPDQGILLLERGSQNEERLLYESNSLSDNSFTSLFRGKQCTVDVSHAAHTELIWAGLAEVVSLGPDSGASDYDGLATGYRGDMFFRGDGYGFSYRVPIDPTQSVPPNYLGSDDQLQWGHVLRQPDGSEAPDLGAWACLYFVPKFTFSESTSGDDVNRDGDTTDIFDVGQIRRRIWSAACSTGEEPYTLAMTVHKHVQKHRLDLKILATDISTRVLAHAQAGIYDEDRLVTVPDPLKSKYFRAQLGQGTQSYAVSEQLKQMIMFHRLNFTVFPYPIKGMFDVIFCRNAMIYFDRDLRTRMVREFARLLKPGGILMIGHSETLMGLDNLYRTIKPSVYLRLNDGVDG